MKLRKLSVIAAVLMFAFTANIMAQKASLILANELYDVAAYANAMPRYIKVLKKDSNNNDALIKLADCYRRLNDMNNAVKTYEKIISKGIAQPIHKLYYAQALMQTSKYDEAQKYLAEYNADTRGITFLQAIKELNKFFRDTSYYKVKRLPFNSEYNDFSPVIHNNHIVYTSSRKRAYAENHVNTWTDQGFFKLYYTTKKSEEKYTKPHVLPYALDNRFNSGPACFSKQSNVIYLTRNNIVNDHIVRAKDGQVKMQLYAATLNKKGTAYEYLLDFKYNNKEYNFMHPAISNDGKKFYFVSDIPGGKGGYDIWECTRLGDTSWTAPRNLGEKVNTIGDEAFPYIKDDQLFFSSNGLEGIGGYDIFSVYLDTAGFPAGTPKNIGVPVNSTADDFGIAFYPEGNKGVFSSNRINLKLDDDIFGFTYTKPNKEKYVVQVMDSTLKLLESNIDIADSSTGEKTNYAEKEGTYLLELSPEHNFKINASSNGYYPRNDISYTSPPGGNDTLKIILDKIHYYIAGKVYEKSDQNPAAFVDSVLVEITDPDGNVVYSHLTDATQKYHSGELLPDTQYKVTAMKDGYFTQSELVPSIPPGGTIVDLYISRIVMQKTIRIENIYFDYDKYDIRPDAAKELDKIVTLLKDNPGIIIELGSHTDCRASKEYNETLSQHRAESSVAYIVSKGIDKSRITAKGYGENQLVNNCSCEGTYETPCTEEEHQFNRRTEFKVTGFIKGMGSINLRSEKGENIIVNPKPPTPENKKLKGDEPMNNENNEQNPLLNEDNGAVNEIIYRIQIMSSDKELPLDNKIFKGLENISKYKYKGYYKYTWGETKDPEEAKGLQQQMKDKGYSGAFIVPFYKNKRISMDEAQKIINKK